MAAQQQGKLNMVPSLVCERHSLCFMSHDVTFYGCKHSLFYPYDSFFIINILFYPQLHFTPGLQSAVSVLH